MSISRSAIIVALRQAFESLPQVDAMWLEGADSTGRVDEYSDLDVCCAVQAGCFTLVEIEARTALAKLGALDQDSLFRDDHTQRDITLHLQDSSPYLLIDLCLYCGMGSDFTSGDEIEKPLILFDRIGAVRFRPQSETERALNQRDRLGALQAMVAQSSRVHKYVARGEFLEAFGYYQKYLLAPLIEVLRMRYTPLHPYYGIVHISRHLPADVRLRLEGLHQVSSLAELSERIKDAELLLKETVAILASSLPYRQLP